MTKIKSNSQLTKGFTLIELLIVVVILGILSSTVFQALTGRSQSLQCIENGGSWTEGIIYGEYTAFCSYNQPKQQ